MKYSKLLLYIGILFKILLVFFVVLDLKLMVAGSMASLGLIICLAIISDSKDSLVQDLRVQGLILKNSGSNFVYGKQYFESIPYRKSIQRFVEYHSLYTFYSTKKVTNILETNVIYKYELFKAFVTRNFKQVIRAYGSQLRRYFRSLIEKINYIKVYSAVAFGEIYNKNELYINID